MTIKYILNPLSIPCDRCLDVLVKTIEKYSQSSSEYKSKLIFVFKEQEQYDKLEQEIKERKLLI